MGTVLSSLPESRTTHQLAALLSTAEEATDSQVPHGLRALLAAVARVEVAQQRVRGHSRRQTEDASAAASACRRAARVQAATQLRVALKGVDGGVEAALVTIAGLRTAAQCLLSLSCERPAASTSPRTGHTGAQSPLPCAVHALPLLTAPPLPPCAVALCCALATVPRAFPRRLYEQPATSRWGCRGVPTGSFLVARGSRFGMAVSADERWLVVSSHPDCPGAPLTVYSLPDGSFFRAFGAFGSSSGPLQFVDTLRLCFTPCGTLLVVDGGSLCIQEVTVAGVFVRVIGAGVFSQYSAPFCVAACAGLVGVGLWPGSFVSAAPCTSARVVLLDNRTGRVVRRFGCAGASNEKLGRCCSGIQFARNGALVVVSTIDPCGPYRVSVFTRTGAFVMGVTGAELGFTAHINDVAAPDDDSDTEALTIVALSSMDKVVQVFKMSSLLSSSSSTTPLSALTPTPPSSLGRVGAVELLVAASPVSWASPWTVVCVGQRL